jgi:type I restriction enzyme S subunit
MDCGGNDAALAGHASGPAPEDAPSFERVEEGERAADGFNVFDAIELPADWSMQKLGDIAVRVTGGGTPSTKVSQYWDGEMPWTTSAVIGEEDIYLTKHQRCITPKGLAESSTQLIPKGSVLIGTRVGVGKAAVTTCDIAISQDLTALVPKVGVSAEFIALALKCAPLAAWFEENKRGTTIKGVSRNDVLRLMIPLPGFPEQRAIAGMLRTVQRAKEACERVLAATRQLKQSLLYHLFTSGPVPFAYAAHVPLKETEMGSFPKTWRQMSLGELCADNDGAIQTGPFGSQLHKSDYVDDGVPVVNPTHLLGNRINHSDVPMITKAKAAELSRHRLRVGDVLFARRGEIGRHGFVTQAEDGWQCGTGCFIVRVNHGELFNAFLPWFFARSAVVEWLESNAAGAIMPNLNNTTLARLPVLYPSLPEQRDIAAQLSAVDAKLAAEESRRSALVALFQSLLHHLMTSQVRLPEFAQRTAGHPSAFARGPNRGQVPP